MPARYNSIVRSSPDGSSVSGVTPVRRVRHSRWVGLFAALLAGCTGGTVYIIPADMQKLEPGETLLSVQRSDRAVFWYDGEAHVNVVISRGNVTTNSGGPRDNFGMTLVLDGVPAGSARMYRIAGRTLRAIRHSGALHERFASIRGVVTISREADDRLSGRFRITCQRQYFDILTGWNTTANTLVVGEFTARLDEAAGQELAERINQDTLPRPAVSTQPAKPRQVIGPPVGK